MILKNFFGLIVKFKNKILTKVQEKHTDVYLGIGAALFCGILAIFILFLTPVLGVADDGTLYNVIQGAGLSYPYETQQSPSYFVREYVWSVNDGSGYKSSQTLIINIAKMIDYFFTNDRVFDIRFLGLLYLIMFLPAVAIVVKALSERLSKFSQKIVPFMGAIFIFADVGYITYFNSFYPEALIFICLLYMAGSALNLQKESKFEYLWLIIFTVFGVLLCFVRQYCFVAGLSGIMFLLFCTSKRKELNWKSTTVILSIIMSLATLGSFIFLESDFNSADKLHSMTRGVLMQSKDPEKILEEFGIDQSYSILTDISAYDEFPVTTPDNKVLEEEFLSKYNVWNVVRYYFRYPMRMVSMLDLAAKNNMTIVRESCGNYEQSQGMPAGARSIFWSAYGIFKDRSLPKTIGYMAILVIISIALTARGFSLKKSDNRKNMVYLECITMLTFFSVVSTCFFVVQSGQVALIQYNGQMGIITDFLLLFTVTEMLDLFNIL